MAACGLNRGLGAEMTRQFGEFFYWSVAGVAALLLLAGIAGLVTGDSRTTITFLAFTVPAWLLAWTTLWVLADRW